MTGIGNKSEVSKLNQAILVLVKFTHSCLSNIDIVVRSEHLPNPLSRTVSYTDIANQNQGLCYTKF